MKYYVGSDLGTSALKMMLVGQDGAVKRVVSKNYSVSFPKSGWSEQSPEDWWNAFIEAFSELTEGIDKNAIVGIGIGGQMHGLVILDERDQVIRPAILWNDGRTDSQTRYLNDSVGEKVLVEHTANIAFAGFTLPKLLWLKENEPDNFRSVCKIMLPKDYLNYKLTGIHSTDYSDAAGTLLLDVEKKCWSSEMLHLCGISLNQMPTLFESFDVVGTVLPTVAQQLGLSEKTIVVAGAGDNAAAALGTGTIGKDACNISLGTSGTIFVSLDKFREQDNHAIHSFCHADGGYHLLGCILSAASCCKWFCEEILHTSDFSGEEQAISQEMLGQNEVFFLPYLMGERSPINDSDATGIFIGMRPNTSRSQLLQAVMEGVAFAIKDNLEIIKKLGIQVEESCLCGGGGKSKLWRQILCNVLNIPLKIPVSEEGPGYGAAILAMVGTKQLDTVEDGVQKFVRIKETIMPDPELVAVYQKQYQKFKKIYPAIQQLYKQIKE